MHKEGRGMRRIREVCMLKPSVGVDAGESVGLGEEQNVVEDRHNK
jgi:hypothetical protein